MTYLRERRAALGGYLPMRRAERQKCRPSALESYAKFALRGRKGDVDHDGGGAPAYDLLRDKASGRASCRSSQMKRALLAWRVSSGRSASIRPVGQLYEPEDASSLLSYREAREGQLLEEGITEAGALSSWIAAATAYSVHGLSMLPFYIYYSMFGFQRVGDLIWAAADQRARGFLLGATAGRTTLGGEGLQHQDGSSHVMAATAPNCRAYDPAFACELAVIFDHGMRRMLDEQADEFYYITLMNESYPQPSMPDGVEADIVAGLYRVGGASAGVAGARVRLLGSGAILREAIAAAEMLARIGALAATSSARRASVSSRARRPKSSAGTGCIPMRREERAMSRSYSPGARRSWRRAIMSAPIRSSSPLT